MRWCIDLSCYDLPPPRSNRQPSLENSKISSTISVLSLFAFSPSSIDPPRFLCFPYFPSLVLILISHFLGNRLARYIFETESGDRWLFQSIFLRFLAFSSFSYLPSFGARRSTLKRSKLDGKQLTASFIDLLICKFMVRNI